MLQRDRYEISGSITRILVPPGCDQLPDRYVGGVEVMEWMFLSFFGVKSGFTTCTL